MGTKGVGPFDSDTAADFADRLAHLTAARRTERVRSRLRRAGGLPGEVVAAAAVVAASLPAGANLPWNEDYEGIESWLNQDEIDDLARLADRALEAAFPLDGRPVFPLDGRPPGGLGPARTVLDLLHLVLRAHLELKPRFR